MTFERDLQDERSGFAAEPASDASSTLIAFGGVRGGMGITVGEAAVALDAVVGGPRPVS